MLQDILSTTTAMIVLYESYQPDLHSFIYDCVVDTLHLLNPFYELSHISRHLVLCWYIHTRGNHLLQN